MGNSFKSETPYTMSYSNFVGVDLSSDPRAVARNRLAYCVNMWRDYESEQGLAIETFPGFRRVVDSLGQNAIETDHNYDQIVGTIGAVHGLFHFRSRSGLDYVVVHAGTQLYAFESEALAKGDYLNIHKRSTVLTDKLSDSDSTSFVFNNNLYILDGSKLFVVSVTAESDGTETVTASEIGGYVPTTYYYGKPYEQRNMLSDYAYEIVEAERYTDRETESATFDVKLSPIYEVAESIVSVQNIYTGEEIGFEQECENIEINGETISVVKNVYLPASELWCPIESGEEDSYKEDDEGNKVLSSVKLLLKLHPNHFSTIENVSNFAEGNLGYKATARDAICKCTKCAVYDGRIFLTGNPALPNTVFYSQRNLTGANDPSYFGAYNYFNDGDGNAPNVDLLSTPSMLMVLKQSTSNEGSIYYHVGASNSDSASKDLVPRIYPATTGAAGLGSVANLAPGSCACNFLDDVVFLSKRGLEAIGKQTVNLERTLTHRSSNVDKFLIREDLSKATLAEWKGYLVICCEGHMYLADSRHLFQHSDGSYQYEWFYLEGVGTYEEYGVQYELWPRYWPLTDSSDSDVNAEPCTLDNYLTLNIEPFYGKTVGELFSLYDGEDLGNEELTFYETTIRHPSASVGCNIIYAKIGEKRYLAGKQEFERIGQGNFFGASKILSVNDRLIFGTANGDICIVNTDKRGQSVEGREVDFDKIDRSFYSFNGVAYLSGCSVRLDDCDKKSLLKATAFGTTAARFKVMPGSKCSVSVSVNGRDWTPLGEAFNSRFDFADIDFNNFSFAENEDHVVIFPEITRGWINKQYYFYSDGFEAPFGLYEISYLYRISGRIRY